MSKNKHKTSKQEKAEIRRQAFSSCQGKIKKLTTDKVYLMEKNKELESKLQELFIENNKLKGQLITAESRLSLLQTLRNMSDEELNKRLCTAEQYAKYATMLGPLLENNPFC